MLGLIFGDHYWYLPGSELIIRLGHNYFCVSIISLDEVVKVVWCGICLSFVHKENSIQKFDSPKRNPNTYYLNKYNKKGRKQRPDALLHCFPSLAQAQWHEKPLMKESVLNPLSLKKGICRLGVKENGDIATAIFSATIGASRRTSSIILYKGERKKAGCNL